MLTLSRADVPASHARFGAAMHLAGGISLVNLLYLDVWSFLSLAKSRTAFFLVLHGADYAAAIVTVLVVGTTLGLVAWHSRRWPSAARRAGELLFLATVVLVADALRKYRSVTLPFFVHAIATVEHAIGTPVAVVLALAGAALVWRYSRALSWAYGWLLVVLSPFAVVTTLSAAHTWATTDFRVFDDVPARTAAGGPAAPRRTVVLIFDELDEEMAFDRRPRDVALPELDAFRAHAITFDSAQAPARNTAESLPSYLLGAPVATLTPRGPRAFVATLSPSGTLDSDSASTLFAIAARLGVRSAIAGFYLPYCRLALAALLDRCYWIPMVEGGAVGAHATVLAAARDQLRSLNPVANRLAHVERYAGVTAHAEEFAADSTLGLVFVHLPVPHLPPIFDHRTGRYRMTIVGLDGYFGNLMLADAALGRVHAAMERAHEWDRSTIIVTSDHPWRNKRDYAPDAVDQRIPLLVKLPGQQHAVHVPAAVRSLGLDSLVARSLSGTLSDTAAVRGLLSPR